MAGNINININGANNRAQGLYNIYSTKNNKDLFLEDNLFQTTLENAIESLNRISEQENKANFLINEYVEGRAKLEDVIIQMEKATVSITLAMTVLNSVTQTTKEILQMAV
jgi:flagellar hook-basal body complex protein FliE